MQYCMQFILLREIHSSGLPIVHYLLLNWGGGEHAIEHRGKESSTFLFDQGHKKVPGLFASGVIWLKGGVSTPLYAP